MLEEKRTSPRIKTNLKLNILDNLLGESVDLSEGGMSFNSTEVISSPTVSLKIHFPEKDFEFKTNAKLVWQRNLEDGSSLYGVEFVSLNEAQKAILREELIKTQISGLLNEVKNPEVGKQISHFFLKDVLAYVNEINKLISQLAKEKESHFESDKKLDQLNCQILLKGYCLEELLSDRKITQKVKDDFRKLVGIWAYKSKIVKRAFEKPRGYSGDYKMIEIVYDNKPISKDKDIGLCFDNYFLRSPYAVAVRIRKDRLREILKKFINESKLNRIDILNIACGSCREIKELLPSLKTQSYVAFTCLDWDEKALKFSQDLFSKDAQKNAEFKFLKEDIMHMVKSDNPVRLFGKFDLIYSIGLIDYLPDRVLKKLIQVSYQLLREAGVLILTHKNKEKTFPPLPPDWFCDWKFVPRNKDEVLKLIYGCGISNFSLSVDSDDFEYIYYFTIIKRK